MREQRFINKIIYVVIVAVLSLALVLVATSQKSESVSGINCPSSFSVFGSTSGTLLAGVVQLKFAVSDNTVKVSRVVFRSNDKPIGRAQAISNYNWIMPWDTSLHPKGQVHIDAEVYIEGMPDYCAATGFTREVADQPQSELRIDAIPSEWDGPKSWNLPIDVIIRPTPTGVDPTPYALYSWQTSIGALSSVNNNNAQFSTGKTEGTGKVTVTARYGGRSGVATIPITVRSLDAPLPVSQTIDDTISDSESTEARTESEPETSVLREATLQNNPDAQNCVVNAIGESRYKAINSGQARPTIEEIQKFKACFASSNYIIPYNFAPVEPSKVSELPKTDKVSVRKPTNSTIKNEDNSDKEVIVLSGNASPNSLVLIYIFSDPLVLTTSANENGEWTYTLEDPIEPGDHEVYTVVDRGDGVYERSDPIAFSIVGTAEAADSNPSGLSLRLSDQATPTQSNRSLVLYAGASIASLLVVGLAVLLALKMRRKSAPLTETPTVGEQPTTGPIIESPQQTSSEPDRPTPNDNDQQQ